jgi:hypothetical protein
MPRIPSWLMATIAGTFVLLAGAAIGQDRYAVQVPNGLSLSEFRGYETWQVVAQSATDELLNVIVANPVMIDAYKAGIPENGRPFPDGSKSVKIQWKPKKSAEAPFPVNVPDILIDVAVMVRDSKRFADSGNWGYGLFNHVTASDTFTPATLENQPPQGNDAKGGFACHTIVKTKDYVFTAYPKR